MIVESLKENEIFVFGSNLNGHHYGGAAKFAYNKFGAVWGEGTGHFGQSYALPTLDRTMQKLPLSFIKQELQFLITYAKNNPHLTFYLTPIGTGIAGFTLDEIESIIPELPVNIIKTFNNKTNRHA